MRFRKLFNLNMLRIVLFVLFSLHTVFAAKMLRGSGSCDRKQLLEMAEKIKSPNTIYYIVSVISLKTSNPPSEVAKCLGFNWKHVFTNHQIHNQINYGGGEGKK